MTTSAPTRPRARSLVAVVTVGLLLGACGGGSDGATPQPSPILTPSTTSTVSPTPVTTTSAPSATATPTPTLTSSSSPVAARTAVGAYFVRQEKLAPVARTATGVATARGALLALLQGPTAAERTWGASTAVPAGTTLRSLRVAGATAFVDLSGTFASGGGSFSMGARWAQVVATLTQFPAVTKVRLLLDGVLATTLGGEGLIVDHPMGRADVESWLPAILVDTPAMGATVSNPVRVAGSADVFEAVLFLQLQDRSGRVLRRQRVMATSGTGTRGTFAASLPYPTSARPAVLVGYALSPKDGTRINVVTIPVTAAGS